MWSRNGFCGTDLYFVRCSSRASIFTQLRSNILIEIDDLACVCVWVDGYVCVCMHAPAHIPFHCILFRHWTKHVSGQYYLLADNAAPLLCIMFGTVETWGTQWHIWLRHYATSWTVVGLIPNDITVIFCWHNPSGHAMVLGSTQPLTEMSTRNTSWGVKVVGAEGW
jgi:hypothetical protein